MIKNLVNWKDDKLIDILSRFDMNNFCLVFHVDFFLQNWYIYDFY